MTQSTPFDTSAEPTALQGYQCTIGRTVTQAGIGLHSGQPTQVTLLPTAENTGRVFCRVDLPDLPTIPAKISSVNQTLLSTQLAAGDATVRTVEHLLAALVALGIDNVLIEVDGPEIPLIDGSAKPWVEALQSAGRTVQSSMRATWSVSEPVWVRKEDAFVVAMPAAETRLTYGIDFSLSAIGNQWHSWAPHAQAFSTEIAPARTFGLAHQIDHLRSQGLIKGGSLDNALVCDRDGWVNPPLRFENEPARHKLLDLIGDLSLLGTLPLGHVMAYKASHDLHVQLARKLSETTLSG